MALSDVLQGPVLARVVRDRGFDNVGLLHTEDERIEEVEAVPFER